MKKAILFLAVLTAFASAQGQSCCKMNSNQDFAQLAMNENFAAAHLNPLPFKEEKPKGKEITFSTGDGLQGSAYLLEAAEPTTNWIFIYHEWWGLNDYIRKEADKIQASVGNCNVIAIDLYDGKVANEAKDAQALSSSLNEERARSIIKGAIGYAGGDAKIVSLGWCMGGGWSLQSAMIEEGQAVGCVIYYGMPEKEVDKLRKLQCDILGFYGQKDQFISPKLIAEFQENLKTAEIKSTIKFYNAEHAFANPSNPKHDVAATNDAYGRTIKYIKEKFGIK